MAEIIASVDNNEVFTVINKDYFKNFEFPGKKIGRDGVIIDLTNLPQMNVGDNSVNKPPTPGNHRTMNVNKLTTYHYLEAQKIKNTNVKLTMVAPSTSKKPDDCVVEAINDNSKIYTPFSGTAKTFNNGVAISNDFANFLSWLNDIKKIFSEETGKWDKLERAGKETLYYVPYLGQLLSIGQNVAIGDFKNALTNIGIIVLLEIAPELNIPLMAAFEAYNEYQTLESFRKTVDKVIDERNKRWHSVYSLIAHQWYGQVHIQIEQRLNHVYQVLSYQADAIKKGIDIEYDRYSGPDKHKVRTEAVNCIESINQSVIDGMKNIEKFLEKSSLLYFEEEILPKAHKNLEKFDKDTKDNLYKFIDSFEQRPQSGLAELSESKKAQADINNGFRPIKFDYKLLTSLMNSESLIDKVVLENDLIFNLGVKGGRIQDLSKKAARLNIGTDTRVVHGRDNEAIRLNSTESSSIEIEKNENLSFLNYNNFSLSFWIRVPRYNKFDKDKDFNNEYTIINNMDANKGFKISIENGILYWTLKGATTIKREISESKFANTSLNLWTHVTIANNKVGNCTIYVNGVKVDEVPLSGLGNITNTLPITLKLVGNKNTKQFIRLDQFNIYKRDLNSTEVKMLFNSYFKDDELRDFWGETLAYNKKYYMQNIAFIGCGLENESKLKLQSSAVFSPIGDNNYIPRLYRGYEITLNKPNDTAKQGKSIIPKKDDSMSIKQGDRYIVFPDNINLKGNAISGFELETYLLLSSVGKSPKDVKITNEGTPNKNCIEIKNEIWNSPSGRMVPVGRIGINDDKYLWAYADDSSKKKNLNWYFICEDEGWIDSNGNFETA